MPLTSFNYHFGSNLEASITPSPAAVILVVVQALILLLVPELMHYVKLLSAFSLPLSSPGYFDIMKNNLLIQLEG